MENLMSRASSLHHWDRSSRGVLLASILVAVVAGAVALSTAASAATPKQIAVLKVGFNSGGNIPTIGLTHQVSGSSGIWLAQLGQEQAFRLTSDGVMHPWLVTGWKRIGGAGWTYHVRPGVKFWDGHELTAADVAASWNFTAFGNIDGQQPGGKVNPFYKNVASIKATSTYHVLVTMKTPDATWRTVPSQYFAGISERSWLIAHDKTLGEPGTLFMGTGPYIPSNFNPTSGVDFSANPNYWNKAAYPPPFKKIHVSFYANEQGLALAARAGDVDLALSVGNPATFKATSGWKVTTAPTCGVGMMSMPTQTAPFNDLHVRRAIAYALNRADVLKATGGGAVAGTNYIVSTGLLQLLAPPATVAKALQSVPTYPYNVAKAKAELAKSAYRTGVNVTMTEANDPTTLNVSQVIAAQLAKIGIKATVNAVSTAAYFGVLLGPVDKRPFMYIDTGACQPDPSWEPSLFLGTGTLLNEANWEPASVDALLQDGRTNLKPLARLATYVAINKAVNTEVPYVPLYLDGASYSSNKYVWTGYGPYWLDEPWALFLTPTGK
jgi:peptide/nickel transport system substrate-binding protein